MAYSTQQACKLRPVHHYYQDVFMGMPSGYDYIWYWKSRLPERHRQRCRVLVRGKMNSIAVEFQDGFRVVTSRYAVRKINPDEAVTPI